MIARVFKIGTIVIGSLLGLLLLVVVFINAGFFNGFIARTISAEATKSIQGKLEIQYLKGSVFSNFKLGNIYLQNGTDTLLFCPEIEVEYTLKALLYKRLKINELKVNKLSMFLKQEADSAFNLARMFANENSTEEDTVSQNHGFTVSIEDIVLDNFNAVIKTIDDDTSIPKNVLCSAQASAYYSSDSLHFSLKSFHLNTLSPNLSITELSGKVAKNKNQLSWEDVSLQLPNTFVKTNGKIGLDNLQTVHLNANISPLDLNDLKDFLPGIEFNAQPNVAISLLGNANKYSFKTQINEAKQKVDISGILQDLNGTPNYTLTCRIKNIDGEYWTQNKLLSTPISGNLKVSGTGLNFKEAAFNVEGEFKKINIGNYSFKDLSITSSKNKGAILGELSSQTSVGDIHVKYDAKEIFTKPTYRFWAKYKHLNLQNIAGIDSIYTNLNGSIDINGSGISPESLNASFKLNSQNSEIQNLPIHDFNVIAHYNKGNYSFSDLLFDTPYFYLKAQGKGNVFELNHINLEFEPRNINPLLSEFNVSGLSVAGKVNASLTGTVDSLLGHVNMSLSNFEYDSIRLAMLDAQILLHAHKGLYEGDVALNVQNIGYNSMDINSVNLTSNFSNNLINSNLQINVNDSLSATLNSTIEGLKNPIIHIHELGIYFNTSQWKSNQDSAYIALNKNDVFIHRFNLNSGNQNIDIHGLYSFNGEEDIKVSIERFQLQQLPFKSYIPYRIAGDLTSYINISGSAKKPSITSNLHIENFNINNYSINSIQSQLNYTDSLLVSKNKILSQPNQSIGIDISLPMLLSFTDSVYLLKDSPEFVASAQIDSINLKQLYNLYPLPNIFIGGEASAHVRVGNTVNKPMVNGKLLLSNATFSHTFYGADYNDIQLNAQIINSYLSLKNFSAKTKKKGTLNMQGYIHLNSDSLQNSDDFNLTLQASNFQALKSEQLEVNLNSAIELNGTYSKPKINGEIVVNRSRVNADYFNHYLSQKTDDPNPPLLEVAMQKEVVKEVSVDTMAVESPLASWLIYKNMSGEVLLKIPSNTWVRGKDMNFELNGLLRAIKSPENIDLFGNLKVRKGYYKLYGRNFNIKSGELNFTGGKEINPYVDFIILYKFRDIEKELRLLQIQITGRMLEPKMAFELDDEGINEKDAIAYIVFGKNTNQLSDNQKSKVFNSEELALNLALDQLSAIVKESLIKSTGLDVVEVSGEDKWKSSSVTLGKYVTNKLYLSYEQSFILDKKTKSVNTEKMILEYQILRSLILKATNQNTNSGFDLIIKKSWK